MRLLIFGKALDKLEAELNELVNNGIYEQCKANRRS